MRFTYTGSNLTMLPESPHTGTNFVLGGMDVCQVVRPGPVSVINSTLYVAVVVDNTASVLTTEFS